MSAILFLADSGQAKPDKHKRVKSREYKTYDRRIKEKIKADKIKAHAYKKIHDLNNDGKVDGRDRLMWLRNKGGNYDPVLVSTDNEDIVNVMDLNGDGSVDKYEMKEFYNIFDLNGDGRLDDYEIDQAVE